MIAVGVLASVVLALSIGLLWRSRLSGKMSAKAGSTQSELLQHTNMAESSPPHSGVNGLLAESYTVATIPSGWSEKAGLLAPVPAEALPPSVNAVRLVSGFEGSVTLDARNVDDTHIVIRFPSAATIWYLFKLENLRGRKVRIDFQNVRADRWLCNRPMFFDATTDLSGSVQDVNGKVEEWTQVSKVWGALDAVSFEQTFPSDSVYVATRVPYTPSYNESYLSQVPKIEGISVEDIGRSLCGRSLKAVVFSGPGDASKTRPCIIAYAREHANEPDSSWAVQGMIEFLRSDTAVEAKRIRDSFTVILIPLLDPDGAAVGAYDRITDFFARDKATVEAKAYARWFQDWVNQGNRLDVVMDIHNPALGPYLNLNFPQLDSRQPYTKFAAEANSEIMSEVQRAGFTARTDAWAKGELPQRLCGWLSNSFGPAVIPYEVNSQGLGHFLRVAEVKGLGEQMLIGCANFLATQQGTELLRLVDTCQNRRSSAKTKWAALMDIKDDVFTSEARIRWYSTGEGEIIPPPVRR
jgi:hypothetical protein